MGISEAWLLPFIPASGGIALDVGANHGEWTRELASRFVQVYAVEPSPGLRPELEAAGENVHVFSMGALDIPRYHPFTIYAADVHLSTFFTHGGIGTGEPHGTVWLWCQPLDDLPIEGPVSFLKIDVEGAEQKAVLGAQRMIQRDRPRMIIEVHSHQQGFFLIELLSTWDYSTEIIRHPSYEASEEFARDPLWTDHYWLICTPGEVE